MISCRPRRLVPRIAVPVIVTATCLAANTVSASAAGTPSWRIVKTVLAGGCSSTIDDVFASGPLDGWAAGSVCETPPKPLLEHWTGRQWYRVRVPSVITNSVESDAVVSASSGRDVWVFGLSSTGFGHAVGMHWDGVKWTRADFPVWSGIDSAVVLGPKDAWAFGQIITPFAAFVVRYDGKRWRRVPFPLAPSGASNVSAVSANDIWVVGDIFPPRRGRSSNALAHWNGSGWSTVLLPTLGLPAGQGLLPTGVVAFGPKDVWVEATHTQGQGVGGGGYLLQWNGRRWHRATVPFPTDALFFMCQDGHGGLWLAGYSSMQTGFKPYFYHENTGHWTRQLVPSLNQASTQIMAMSWIPGTTSAWSAGELLPKNGTQGVILRYQS